MKKNVLALGVAAAVAGFAGSAFAVTDYQEGTAAALQLSTTGTGHMLVVPYFSAQNGNKTLLSLTNTDATNGKAVKIRFRGAANSDDVYDFQVFLSPGDIWTADIHQGADGFAALTTADNSCTKPANVNQSFKSTRFDTDWSDAVKQSNTREGYIEIFNMGDIAPASDLFVATKHDATGKPPCASVAPANAWTDIDVPARTTANLNAQGLVAPTTGLMANWTIINVPNATAWSGAATAIEAVTAAVPPVPGTGAVVYFPQVNATVGGPLPAGTATLFTADPLLRAGVVSGQAQFDLPDMSTLYAGVSAAGPGPVAPTAADPVEQAAALTTALATNSINNEFWTLDGISGATDWVFSMPTRRYSGAVQYGNGAATPAVPDTVVYTDLSTSSFATNFFTAANLTLPAGSSIACVNGITNHYWNREEGENVVAAGDTSASPGDAAPTPAAFCGETSVLSINDVPAGSAPTKVLGAEVAVRNCNLTVGGARAQEGWMRLDTPGLGAGLPIIGSAFMSAYNPEVAAGVAGNFSMTFPHRTTRP